MVVLIQAAGVAIAFTQWSPATATAGDALPETGV